MILVTDGGNVDDLCNLGDTYSEAGIYVIVILVGNGFEPLDDIRVTLFFEKTTKNIFGDARMIFHKLNFS